MRNKRTIKILISLMFLLSACGEIEEAWEDFENANEAIVDVADPGDSFESPPSTTTTTTIPSMNPVCDRIYHTDGAGGFLWKPISESTGSVAVQLPGVFATKFDKCEIHGQYAYESLTFHGFHNWDGQDRYRRDRQLWRGSFPGSHYGGDINLVCKQTTQECSWQFSDAHLRRD